MTKGAIVLGVLILVCALFLIISVLLQSSKNHRMSGVVSGGADTFFGKQKGKTIDAVLSKATAVISIIFCVLILVLYITTAKADKKADENAPVIDVPGVTTKVETEEITGETETADTETTDTETADTETAETEVSE
ncbi:MAG: preprotein translocase subunit SecG [Clostridia bacterium]|nr:preprotein translocase subunit SecG [Clostridia bacterium]